MSGDFDKQAPPSEATPLRIAGSWLQALTEGSKEVVALLDGDGSVQYLTVSGAVQHMLGYDALEIMDMKPGDLLHPLDLQRVLEAFAAVAAHPEGRISVDYRARHRQGHYVRLESTAINRLRNQYVNAIVVHTRDLPSQEAPPVPSSIQTLLKLEEEEELVRALTEAVEKAQASDYRFSVMLLAVDRDEKVLKAYGQDVVDGVHRDVGRRLSALLRPGDRLAQLESGYFAVLLDEVGEKALAMRIGARIQKTVGTRFSVRGQDVLTSVVMGIATSERRYDRADDMIRDAMVAMGEAGGEGAERAVFRTRMHVHRARHMSLMAELHNAVQHGQFRVYYMPIVSLATRTMVGFEALARWEHPERGVISPALFIPLAEETRLIIRLGRWVMLEASRQMAEWQTRYPLDPPLWLSVNTSPVQFADFDLDDQVKGILEDTGLDPTLLALDIPEGAVQQYREGVTEVCRRLRRMGVKVSLDNFGVGASSLSTLHDVGFDRLKIDRSLIASMASGARDREMVQAIINLAHGLSLEVVGEGVEAPGQAAQLSKLWCEYAQGYLFGKPLDADAAGALIASYPTWWR